MMKKRLLLVIMLLSSVLILSAWGEVELLDDGKLIDLDKAIEFSMPGADIIGFNEKGIKYLEYEETESYRITEMMINHRDLMVSQLLQEED